MILNIQTLFTILFSRRKFMSNKKRCRINNGATRAIEKILGDDYPIDEFPFNQNNRREKPKYSQRPNGPRTREFRAKQKRIWEKECDDKMIVRNALQTPTINEIELLLKTKEDILSLIFILEIIRIKFGFQLEAHLIN
jgi:hypothetical protein